MYIALHLPKMAVIYRCERVETIRALVNIEASHLTVAVFEETDVHGLSRFCLEDLCLLFASLSGIDKPPTYLVPGLIVVIQKLLQTVAETKVVDFEVICQSKSIHEKNLGFYEYTKGSGIPKKLVEPKKLAAIQGNWAIAQGLPLPTTVQSLPTPVKAQPPPPAPTSTPPKYPPPWA